MLTLIAAGGVDAVLIADDLPELGPDLVAALAWKRKNRAC